MHTNITVNVYWIVSTGEAETDKGEANLRGHRQEKNGVRCSCHL